MTTREKLASFKTFGVNWHYGMEGKTINNTHIEKLMVLNEAFLHLGIPTNAFPGLNGEVQLTLYGDNGWVEIIVEDDGSVVLKVEKDEKDV